MATSDQFIHKENGEELLFIVFIHAIYVAIQQLVTLNLWNIFLFITMQKFRERIDK